MADYSLLEALLGQRPRRSLMDPPDPDARRLAPPSVGSVYVRIR